MSPSLVGVRNGDSTPQVKELELKEQQKWKQKQRQN